MARLTRIADAMLARLVPQEEAGACVPTQGNPCSTGTYQYKCVEHLKYRRVVNGSVSCTGPCAPNGTYGPWISYTHC